MTRLDHAISGTDKGMTIKSRQNGSILCLLCRFYGRRMNVHVVWWVAKRTETTPEDELSRADMVKVRKWGKLLCTEGSAAKFEKKKGLPQSKHRTSVDHDRLKGNAADFRS